MNNSASHVFILNKKEIENYLLCPGAIAAAASERVAARQVEARICDLA